MGAISASIADSSAAVSLTALGGADYLVTEAGVALGDGYRKAGGGSLISVVEYDPNNNYSIDQENKTARPYSGTDSDSGSFSSPANSRSVNWSNTVNPGGYTVTFPAGIGTRTAKLYIMGYTNNSNTKRFDLICTLSDGSAAQTVEYTLASDGNDNYLVATIEYSADSNGQTLSVTWTTVTATVTSLRATHFGAAWVSSAPASTNYDLDTTPTSFTLTGSSATTKRKSKLIVTPASIALTGANANLKRDTLLTTDPASFGLTYFDADLSKTILMVTDPGSFSLAGSNAELRRDLQLNGETGVFTITGADAELTYTPFVHRMETETGVFSIYPGYADLTYTTSTPSENKGSYASSRRRRR